jgi:hypothetical protein
VYLEVKEIDVRVRANINKLNLGKMKELCRPKCADPLQKFINTTVDYALTLPQKKSLVQIKSFIKVAATMETKKRVKTPPPTKPTQSVQSISTPSRLMTGVKQQPISPYKDQKQAKDKMPAQD